MKQSGRQTERIPVQIPIKITPKEKTSLNLDGEVLNISIDGAFIMTQAPIHVGQEVLVSLNFEEARILEARVVEANPEIFKNLPQNSAERTVIRWNSENMKTGYGVQFIGMHDETRRFLERLIRHYGNLSKVGVTF